jgi:hypothetical protein
MRKYLKDEINEQKKMNELEGRCVYVCIIDVYRDIFGFKKG